MQLRVCFCVVVWTVPRASSLFVNGVLTAARSILRRAKSVTELSARIRLLLLQMLGGNREVQEVDRVGGQTGIICPTTTLSTRAWPELQIFPVEAMYLLVFLTLFFVIAHSLYRRRTIPDRKLPHLRNWLPIVGHIPHMVYNRWKKSGQVLEEIAGRTSYNHHLSVVFFPQHLRITRSTNTN